MAESWILLVDDRPIARLGVRKSLAAQPDLWVGWETKSTEGALLVAWTSKVDLAIVGLPLGSLSGIELIGRLRELKPGLRVLVYSHHEEALRFAELAFTAGADGCVMKQDAPECLIDAIREVLAGRRYVSRYLLSEKNEEGTA